MATKGAKIAFWTVFGLIVGGGIFWFAKNVFGKPDPDKKAKELEEEFEKNQTNENKIAAEEAKKDADLAKVVGGDDLPLRRGSTGEKVKEVQRWLINGPYKGKWYDKYGDDGIFGKNTLDAVKAHISADGQVSVEWYNKNIKPAAPLTTEPFTGIKVGDHIYANNKATMTMVPGPGTVELPQGEYVGKVLSLTTTGFNVEKDGTKYITSGFGSFKAGAPPYGYSADGGGCCGGFTGDLAAVGRFDLDTAMRNMN